jgi:hypothetical protein
MFLQYIRVLLLLIAVSNLLYTGKTPRNPNKNQEAIQRLYFNKYPMPELTRSSPYLIVDSEEECFPNYQQTGKGIVKEVGGSSESGGS